MSGSYNYEKERQLDDIWLQVSERLQNPNGGYQMRKRGTALRMGVCPSCGHKTLWSKYADKPGRVWCDRESKCSYTATAKELFPDLFDPLRIIKTAPPTRENPNATADAYLKTVRGFRLDTVKGAYRQESYDYRPREAKENNLPAEKVVAVRFPLPAPMEGNWDRFINGNHFGKKTTLSYGTKTNGWMWTPPNQQLNKGDKLYVTEGIFDALALLQAGKKVASLMGVSMKPIKFVEEHASFDLQYVVALDNDEAGRKFTPRIVRWLRGLDNRATAIQPSEQHGKIDWNDLHLAGKLKPSNFEDYEYWGKLLIVGSPKEKALLVVAREQLNKFPLTFGSRVYWCEYSAGKEQDNDEESKREDVIQVTPVSTCEPQYLYFQKDIETRESVYYVRVQRPDTNRRYQDAFSPAQIVTDSAFDQRLMGIGSGLMWTGNKNQLKRYFQRYWFNTPEPNEVDCVSFVGYAKEFKAWVFKDCAIHAGQLIQANEFDYFNLGNGKQVKTSMSSDPIHLSNKHEPDLWLKDFQLAYGVKGLFAMTSWFGSLFAEQIRQQSFSYPWTEMSGKPGTGKSSILKFLWKLSGRSNYQGIELSKASHAGRWRSLEQSANLPIVLMEGDAGQGGHQKKGFNLEEAKGTYEGDGMRITAQKTMGSETREPKFRGALWIAQNEQVQPAADAGEDSGRAVMERIVHIHWDKSHFSNEGSRAADRLSDLPMDEINGFMVHCAKNEDAVLSKFNERRNGWVEYLRRDVPALKNDRIRFNHAQMLTLAQTMVEIGAVPLAQAELDDLYRFIVERALVRQKSIEYDHPVIEEFWGLYTTLCESGVDGDLMGESCINYSSDPNIIAIPLNHMESLLAKRSLRMPPRSELRNLLLSSKSRKYVKHNASARHPVTHDVKSCWIFKKSSSEVAVAA